MRIKYIVYTAISNNLGDNAQAYATYQLLLGMDIPREDILICDRDSILEKVEPDTAYIMPCSMSAPNYYDVIGYLSAAGCWEQFVFLPLAIGLIRNTFGDEAHFRKADRWSRRFIQPIGCRDFDSCQMFKDQGYPAYVYGCITNTLPRRPSKRYDAVYLYDVPRDLLPYIPDDIREKAVSLTKRTDASLRPERLWELSVERYETLRDTAALVITTNYHVAVPCAAMGIPVIMVDNCSKGGFRWSNDTRLPGLNPKVPYYTKEQWPQIDWAPEPAEFEEDKAAMIRLAAARIKDAAAVAMLSKRTEEFFEPTKRRFYDTLQKNIGNVGIMGMDEFLGDPFLAKIGPDLRYYLYGLSDRYVEQDECIILEYMEKRFPKAEFLGFVDGKKTGTYFGKPVLSPNEMQIDADTYCLVAAFTANDHVGRLFKERGFDESHLWKMPPEILFYIYHL